MPSLKAVPRRRHPSDPHLLLLLMLPLAACTGVARAPVQTTQELAGPVMRIEGFSGPESVRYDPGQDVYFVANFNGPGGQADDNGFISKVLPDGTVEALRFIEGGRAGVTLHAPRGMIIVGDTLWAADVGAVRGFHRETGAPLATIDFAAHEPGFLNDVTVGPDGALYVTDTGDPRVFRIDGRDIRVVLEGSVLDRPNGITWDRSRERLIVLPYGGSRELLSWRPDEDVARTIAVGSGGRFDGVEALPSGELLVSSQTDSTLVLVSEEQTRVWARTAGAPADIGVDTRRNRVLVPYIALNRVDVWELP